MGRKGDENNIGLYNLMINLRRKQSSITIVFGITYCKSLMKLANVKTESLYIYVLKLTLKNDQVGTMVVISNF